MTPTPAPPVREPADIEHAISTAAWERLVGLEPSDIEPESHA